MVLLELRTTGPGGRAETVPVVSLGAVDDFDVDACVLVVGRVRRRFFRVGGSLQSRTEVVADVVLAARQRRRADAARQAVVRALGAAGEDPDLVPRPGTGAGGGRR